MEEIFKIPSTLQQFKSMNHNALRIVFDTQENLSPDQIAMITKMNQQFGWLMFLPEKSEESEILQTIGSLPALEHCKDLKSPSQRLRATLYVYFTQKGEGDFETFYKQTMESIINQFKEKLV